jgi:hypothetical protein
MYTANGIIHDQKIIKDYIARPGAFLVFYIRCFNCFRSCSEFIYTGDAE